MTAFAALVLIQAVNSSSPAGQWAEDMVERARGSFSVDACRRPAVTDEIVVCGSRSKKDRYRLPMREDLPRSAHVRGDAPRASTEVAEPLRCGIFAGERRCSSKAEAAQFGYGNGRDPLTVATKVIKSVTDPD